MASTTKLLKKCGIEKLSTRRESACESFAKKLIESTRFSEFFPTKVYPENIPTLRKQKTYREEFARMNRLYNSPVYAMRRMLNEEEKK